MGQLEDILNKDGPLINAYPTNYDMPFGAIIYKEWVILCKTQLADGDRYQTWRLIPLGVREANSIKSFSDERYYQHGISSSELKELLLESSEHIVDLIGTQRVRPEYPIWADFENFKNKEIYPLLIDEIAKTGITKGPVLDLGCGVGELSKKIQKLYPKMEVYAIDSHPSNVVEAVARLGSNRVVDDDAENIDLLFPETMFNIVVANAFFEPDVLGHGQKSKKILGKVIEKLVEGGYLIISGYGFMSITRKDISDLGFNVTKAVIPENLFIDNYPKNLYVAQKPLVNY